MPMSSGGRAASSSECVTSPKAREIGLTGCIVPIQYSLLIGRYVMAMAEHREPCDSRGSCTVLGAPEGEIPPGDSTFATRSCQQQSGHVRSALKAEVLCQLLWVDRATRDVFQAPKLEPWIVRYELSDAEWAIIKPFLPNKSRGVPRVNDRQVLNGIFWVLRSGAPWRDLPVCYGPRTTCYNLFVRWRRAGVWGRIMNSLAVAHDAAVQMIDKSIVRVHQHAAC